MSYNVLLVDDDQRILQGLAQHIDWETLGYSSPILATDVASARHALRINKIDLLLTDIRLPDESGLEFCRQVHQQNPAMLIFVLSAFSDFGYACDAIRFGVKRYFTKPTDLRAISAAMAEARRELDLRRRSQENRFAQAKQHTRSYRFLLSNLWSNLAHGLIWEDPALHAFFEENHIEFPHVCFLLLKLSAPPSSLDIAQNFLRSALENAECISYPFSPSQDSVHFLLNVPDRPTLHTALDIFLTNGPSDARLDVSAPVDSLGQLPKCMTQLQHIAGTPGRLCCFDASEPEEPRAYNGNLEKSLLYAIGSCDVEKAMEILTELSNDFTKLPLDSRSDAFTRLLLRLSEYTERFGITLASLYGTDFSISRQIKQLSTPLQMDQWLRNHIRRSIKLLTENQAAYSSQIIQEVRTYISEHFSESITLASVAQNICLSPSYLSRLYKKVTGEKFIDYLTSVRMEKAMELLSSRDSRIYEVAEQVGYKSTKHFSQAFKAHMGQTPFEYKKSICGNQGAFQ